MDHLRFRSGKRHEADHQRRVSRTPYSGELDWAQACGVPSHLLRVSVGFEQPNELWQRFKRALSRSMP
ncbi:MAG: hypothetical protein CMD33_00200 [Flavobacteriales bacterium]|nr:hypothetical protein [Flavobacteriales bacterium]